MTKNKNKLENYLKTMKMKINQNNNNLKIKFCKQKQFQEIKIGILELS